MNVNKDWVCCLIILAFGACETDVVENETLPVEPEVTVNDEEVSDDPLFGVWLADSALVTDPGSGEVIVLPLNYTGANLVYHIFTTEEYALGSTVLGETHIMDTYSLEKVGEGYLLEIQTREAESSGSVDSISVLSCAELSVALEFWANRKWSGTFYCKKTDHPISVLQSWPKAH